MAFEVLGVLSNGLCGLRSCPKSLGLLYWGAKIVHDYPHDHCTSRPWPPRIKQVPRDILKVLALGRLQSLQSSAWASKAPQMASETFKNHPIPSKIIENLILGSAKTMLPCRREHRFPNITYFLLHIGVAPQIEAQTASKTAQKHS